MTIVIKHTVANAETLQEFFEKDTSIEEFISDYGVRIADPTEIQKFIMGHLSPVDESSVTKTEAAAHYKTQDGKIIVSNFLKVPRVQIVNAAYVK